MKEAHGRPVMAGRRDEFDSPHSPSPGSQRSARAPITLSPRDNSQEAIIENLESRLQRLSGINHKQLLLTPIATSSPDPSQAQSKISTPQTLAAHISNRLSQPVTPPTAPAVTAYPSHHNAHSR